MTVEKNFMINLHKRILPTSVGVEPATSWSPVGRHIQMSHRGRPTEGREWPQKIFHAQSQKKNVTGTGGDRTHNLLLTSQTHIHLPNRDQLINNRQHPNFFLLLFFSEKTSLDISCLADDSHEMSRFVFEK